MRILQVSDFYPPFIGGMERHVKSLSTELATRGHDVRVITARLPGTEPSERRSGVDIRRIRGTTARLFGSQYVEDSRPFHPPCPDPEFVIGLRREVERFDPHIVHAHGWSTYSTLVLPRAHAQRVVVTLHDWGIMCPRKTLFWHGRELCSGPALAKCLNCAPGQYGAGKGVAITLGLRASRPLNSRTHWWVGISRAVAEAYRDFLPASASLSVIPSFVPQSLPVSPVRPSWLPAQDDYLLFVGSLTREKGLHWLLEAYERGLSGTPLVVLGTPQHDTPTRWPAGVTVRTNVPHDEVMRAWRHAAIGLVPSLWPEPFGQVAVEAQTAGTPVVATRIGGLQDIVEDGVSGFVVAPNATDELVAAIRKLQADDDLRRRFGEAGRHRAAQFTVTNVAGAYESMFETVDRCAG